MGPPTKGMESRKNKLESEGMNRNNVTPDIGMHLVEHLSGNRTRLYGPHRALRPSFAKGALDKWS
jgi:hypothetical protein